MGYNTDIIGFMLKDELDIIEKIVKNVPINGNIIELGSFFGRSAICMAMSANIGVTIFCIDIFPNDAICFQGVNDITDIDNPKPISGKRYNVEEEFIKNTINFSNIKKIKGDCEFIDYDFPSIDMIFLDSAHSNPSDWNALCKYVPLIKLNGLVFGHDYSDNNMSADIKENVSKLEKIFNNLTLYDKTSLWSVVVTKKIQTLE